MTARPHPEPMPDEKPPPPPPAPPPLPSHGDAREKRLAEALRANLRRRKGKDSP